VRPKFFTAVLLFISAYAPLFLILAVQDFDFEETNSFGHPIAVYIMLLLAVISVFLLLTIFGKISKGTMVVEVLGVQNRSSDLINYTIPYIVSFFGFSLSAPGDVISLLIFLCIMFLLTVRSKAVFLNPVLSLAGYALYDLEYKFDGRTERTIILSKKEVRRGEKYHIRMLTRFLYLIT
jgi:hypothetical protein